jgi:hypothetical protein
MNTVQQTKSLNDVIQEKRNEITANLAWHADLTGPEAESLLRHQEAGTYLLRQGEKEDHYYLSYVEGRVLSHLPIKIDYSQKQWFYQNTTHHFGDDLKAFIPEIMHREEAECHPLVPFAKKK